MDTTIFGTLTLLGTGVIGYLLNENAKLKDKLDVAQGDNAFLTVALYDLTAAIEFTDSVSDDSKLHDVAKRIKEDLKKKIEAKAKS